MLPNISIHVICVPFGREHTGKQQPNTANSTFSTGIEGYFENAPIIENKTTCQLTSQVNENLSDGDIKVNSHRHPTD